MKDKTNYTRWYILYTLVKMTQEPVIFYWTVDFSMLKTIQSNNRVQSLYASNLTKL